MLGLQAVVDAMTMLFIAFRASSVARLLLWIMAFGGSSSMKDQCIDG